MKFTCAPQRPTPGRYTVTVDGLSVSLSVDGETDDEVAEKFAHALNLAHARLDLRYMETIDLGGEG